MGQKRLKRKVIAALLTESLVEICNLNETEKQVFFDNVNPKFVWVRTESHIPGYIPTYDSRVKRIFDIRITKPEYDKLVEARLIPDYLYNE